MATDLIPWLPLARSRHSPVNFPPYVSYVGMLGYSCVSYSPLDLPSLLLEPFVYGLSDGALHEVDVPDDLRRERVAQVLVELAVFQVVW